MAALYIISPPQIELKKFIPNLETALEKYKPAMFQLRLKEPVRNDGVVIEGAKELLPICKKHGVKFIVNDSPEIAQEVGADGVHVGDEDMAIAKAQALLGANKIIGASCYNSIEAARAAVKNGADYVSFGAFYPTTTKQAKSRAEISTLQKWKTESAIPTCAIGGINFENMKPIVEAGADYICMVSAIWAGFTS